MPRLEILFNWSDALIMSNMLMERDKLMMDLHSLVSTAKDRVATLQGVAELVRSSGGYRWVGLYDVDRGAGIVTNIVWSGPGAPEYPTFPFTKGLTGAAISSGKTVNVGDVAGRSPLSRRLWHAGCTGA